VGDLLSLNDEKKQIPAQKRARDDSLRMLSGSQNSRAIARLKIK